VEDAPLRRGDDIPMERIAEMRGEKIEIRKMIKNFAYSKGNSGLRSKAS